GSKTLDELMVGARSSLESGQVAQAIDVQESAVRALEKLYAILTDRQGLEDLERSLTDLRRIKAELDHLADRERDLRRSTSELDQKAAGPESGKLAEGIQKAIEAQRELLSRTEARSRSSDELEPEAIER